MYDKHNIMRNAWKLIKAYGISRSVALKSAWALEKAMIKADKVAEDICWNTKVRVNDWVKGAYNRTYIEVVIYTNAWNRKGVEKIGYIDNTNGEFVAA